MQFNQPGRPRKTLASILLVLSCAFTATPGLPQDSPLLATLARLEQDLDARLGVAILNTDTGQQWHYHADQRFPLSSTFKTLACAMLLYRVDARQERLERLVEIRPQDLVSYSPITENHLGSPGLSLARLCAATLSTSDNTAGNLVLQALGGPEALTRFLRSLGDPLTRLDRRETDLNEGLPGDVRDTTTPDAMAQLLTLLLLEDTLSPSSRQQLIDWLKGNEVGDDLLRAGIPADWQIADKTGAGGYGSRSIAAVMWPPARKPIVVTVYITETEAAFEDRNAAIALIGKEIAEAVLQNDTEQP